MSLSDEISKLDELRQRGVLTDTEFANAKQRVLSGQPAPRSGDAIGAINQFRRSRTDSWLGGVCGGLAETTGLAAWVWRLTFTLLLLCGGAGLALYVLLWIFVPAGELPASTPLQAAN